MAENGHTGRGRGGRQGRGRGRGAGSTSLASRIGGGGVDAMEATHGKRAPDSHSTDGRPAQRPRDFSSSAVAGAQLDHLSDVRFDSLAGRVQPEVLSSIPFSNMTTVQAATLEPAMSGVDILAKAKTGTGKTIAFLLPVIQRLCSRTLSRGAPCPISSLILTPTRELALQIEKEATMLLRGVNGRIGVQHCIGGTNISTEKTHLRTKRADILVATPGRLLDHIENSGLKAQLSQVESLVLDEADRMLDMGFRRELMKIVEALPSRTAVPRQTLLFSATVPEGLSQVAQLQPNHVVINTLQPHEENTHEHVKQTSYVVPHNETFALMTSRILTQLREDPERTKIIIFYPTARTTGVAASLLRAQQNQIPELRSLPVFEVHSRKSQAARTKANVDFGKAAKGILCSSDVTARGIDFPGVTHVMQVGLPANAEQYIHRLGRTARAGAEGAGTLILTPYESFFLKKRDVMALPITQENKPTDLAALQPHVDAALANVSEREKCQAYAANLGYYKPSLKDMRWKASDLVEAMNDWARTALRFQNGDPNAPPPPLLAKTIGKMGLKGTPGLHIVKELPTWADDEGTGGSGTATPVGNGSGRQGGGPPPFRHGASRGNGHRRGGRGGGGAPRS